MGSGNLTPLDELKSLDQQIDSIQTVSGLQPLFARLEEITREHSGNFEVQLVAHDVKQHMLARGSRLKQLQPAPPVTVAPPAASEPAVRGRKFLWLGVAAALVVGAFVANNFVKERNRKLAETVPVAANVSTVPPGAAIQIDGKQTCTSNCVAQLAPGTYTVTAALGGYEAANAQFVVAAGQPAKLEMTLTPQPVSLRILADLTKGQVFLDDKPAGELLDGQFTIERLEPGSHKVRVAGGTSEATFTVVAAPATMPAVGGLIQTTNMFAALVANLNNQARMVTSSGPLKLTLNGQPETDATPDGIGLTNFRTGAGEFVLGDKPSERTLSATFASAPTLTAFLKTDQKIGTLLIATGEDDVRIFVNDREQKRRTAKGQARIQTFGPVTVRVEKSGFDPPPVQTTNVKQGTETKLTFTLKETPRFAALSVSGAAPGTQILLGDRALGAVGSDGVFRNSSIAPGEHVIELRREQYEPKRITRTFRAGETVVIGVGEATLTAIRVVPPPVAAPPPPPKQEVAAPKPAPRTRASGTIAQFDNPGAWQQADGMWKHRGAATLTYSIQPDGIFTFSIYMLKGGSLLRGGRVRWVFNYVDAKNYSLFELDEENFWAKVVENGKTLERKKVAHEQDKSMRVWNIQIDASAQRLIHKIQGDTGWVDLDNWSEPGRDFTKGKFGILVNGTDEVGLSNFSFTGR